MLTKIPPNSFALVAGAKVGKVTPPLYYAIAGYNSRRFF
jgi:hypothetical protein